MSLDPRKKCIQLDLIHSSKNDQIILSRSEYDQIGIWGRGEAIHLKNLQSSKKRPLKEEWWENEIVSFRDNVGERENFLF